MNNKYDSLTQQRRRAAQELYSPRTSREGDETSFQTYLGSIERDFSQDRGQSSPYFDTNGYGRGEEADFLPDGQGNVASMPYSEDMDGYIHESRRGLVNFHPTSDGRPTRDQNYVEGRIAKRLKAMLTNTPDQDYDMKEAGQQHRPFALSQDRESNEGRLSYYDTGDDSEREPTESEPPLGWGHAESLGYTKDYKKDAEDFLDNLAEEMFGEQAVPRSKVDTEMTDAKGSETKLPRAAVTTLSGKQPKVCIDLTEENAEEPVSGYLKLFPHWPGLLTPRRPPMKRATAMEMWGRADEKIDEKQNFESELPHNSLKLQDDIMEPEPAVPREAAAEMQGLSSHGEGGTALRMCVIV